MAPKANRYKEMERYMTVLLITAAVMFVLFLIYSGIGILWAKVITCIFAIVIPFLCLGVLYLTKELFKGRSLWLTTGFFGILICTVVSLLTNFPSPAA